VLVLKDNPRYTVGYNVDREFRFTGILNDTETFHLVFEDVRRR